MDELRLLTAILISTIFNTLLIFLIEEKRKNKKLLRKLERIIKQREDDRKWKL